MKKTFATITSAFAAMAVLFAACTSEDGSEDPQEKGKYQVLGTWTITEVKINKEYQKINDKDEDDDDVVVVGEDDGDEVAEYVLVLNADGTFQTTMPEINLQNARYTYDGEDGITLRGKLKWHDGTTVDVSRTITIVSLKADGAFEIKMKGKYIDPDKPLAEYQAEYRGTKRQP